MFGDIVGHLAKQRKHHSAFYQAFRSGQNKRPKLKACVHNIMSHIGMS